MATNKEMINKFKDMADCADAAYAKLDFVDGFINLGKWYEKEIEYGDKQKLGDKFGVSNSNSTYARSYLCICEKCHFIANWSIHNYTILVFV